MKTFGETHAVGSVKAHAPVTGVQQAPGVGCGHGFGEHTVHSGCQMLGAVHADWLVNVQAPVVGLQQAAG